MNSARPTEPETNENERPTHLSNRCRIQFVMNFNLVEATGGVGRFTRNEYSVCVKGLIMARKKNHIKEEKKMSTHLCVPQKAANASDASEIVAFMRN